MLGFGDLIAGVRLSGVVADGDVTVVAADVHGPGSATLTYRTTDGRLGERIILSEDLAKLSEVSQRRWSFDADGAMFCLASEARRMQQAHLADPFAAVDTSNIEPYPHQIDAVYNWLLTRTPLRCLLADDPGAGKTIMSGLLIRELMLRGDVARCLIIAPGSLVEQWQDEMWDKFGLEFEVMSRATVEVSRVGNPFIEKNLLIARVDQLARSDDLSVKLEVSQWDLVIVDEAHKMSARRYGDELRRTKRFVLGEKLRDCTRHLLLLTATPHNGKNDDFLAFMTLIDPERFAGRLRSRPRTGTTFDTGNTGSQHSVLNQATRARHGTASNTIANDINRTGNTSDTSNEPSVPNQMTGAQHGTASNPYDTGNRSNQPSVPNQMTGAQHGTASNPYDTGNRSNQPSVPNQMTGAQPGTARTTHNTDINSNTGNQQPEMPDASDVMRRRVKESLLTFEGRRLFPARHAHSLNFELSESEDELYEAVTAYVRDGMNRAQRMQAEGDKRRGIIIGFALAGLQRRLASSPAAIYHSLRRRRDRLAEQSAELRRLAASGRPVPVTELPRGVRLAELDDVDLDGDFDLDDYGDAERETLELMAIDAATAAQSADELDVEVNELKKLVTLADEVRRSGTDTKWTQLRDLLRSEHFTRHADHHSTAPEPSVGDTPLGSQPATARKLIVFSEHRDTLDYVADRIVAELGKPEAVVRIHGGIKRHDRRAIQDRFRVDPTVQVLVATDAAGEGVNLQVANMMVNYDLPWNPNRIEQRFGRIHRIGQQRPCHLWNLVAHRTREGQVFKRLFDKIEEQRSVFGDQVYDVLGVSRINISLRDLLMRAIVTDADPAHTAWMDEVIEADIAQNMTAVLEERALVAGLANPTANDKIRRQMEIAKARKLQPWFVESFFTEALRLYGGRITARERGRFEVTRVPAALRNRAESRLGTVHERYVRVTFDKAHIQPGRTAAQSGRDAASERAELISPGTPLLAAVVDKVLADHGHTLGRGAVLVDPSDLSDEPRLLVYLEHSVTDGRQVHGTRQVVSQRLHYVEIDRHGNATDPGGEPYLNYKPVTEDQQALLEDCLDLDWANRNAEQTARAWAIEHLSCPHFDEVKTITADRVARVSQAVTQRLHSEIRYWDRRAAEIRAKETAGGKPRVNSIRAQANAEELNTRLARRRLELDLEADLHNTPPNVVAAALIVPQGLLDKLSGRPVDPVDASVRAETDRRAVTAVVEAEQALGRVPEPQHHSNPGYDVLSTDPTSGICYLIEVKGHLPNTEQISVSRRQFGQARCNPEHWRLAVVSVPADPQAEPMVRYLTDPFRGVTPHPAQTSMQLNVTELLSHAQPPH